MKSISTETAAVALGVDRKLLDNVLSREARKLLGPGRRGKSRRISMDAIELIAIALILNRDLGVSLARALQLAVEVVASPAGRINIGSLGSLTFDLQHLREPLEHAINEAIEGVAPKTRGRPRS